MTKTSTSSQIEAVSLPFTASVFGAYSLFIEKIKSFFVLGSCFAVILTVLYLISGQEALCINGLYRQEHSCSNNIINFVVVHLIALGILCIFMRIWMQVILSGKTFAWKQLLPQMADAKIISLFIVYCLTLTIAGISAYLLIIRIPNPNWKVEFGYFAIVSLGFLAPLLTLRFSAYFAFVANQEPLPTIKILWQKTRGNTFVILASVIVLIFCGLFLSQYFLQTFIRATDFNAFYVVLGSEYLSNMVALFITACFTNYCSLQKTFLFERNDNGKTGN